MQERGAEGVSGVLIHSMSDFGSNTHLSALFRCESHRSSCLVASPSHMGGPGL